MDTYSSLRHFADSWGLVALFAVFAGACLFAWRPGSRRLQAEAGELPFRHDDRPAPTARAAPSLTPSPASCGRGCEGCACTEGSAP